MWINMFDAWSVRMTNNFTKCPSCFVFRNTVSFNVYIATYFRNEVCYVLFSLNFLFCGGRNGTSVGPFYVTNTKLLKKKDVISSSTRCFYLLWIISISVPANMTWVFHGFPKSFHENARIARKWAMTSSFQIRANAIWLVIILQAFRNMCNFCSDH